MDMSRRTFAALLAGCLLAPDFALADAPGEADGIFAGGSGTEDDPWLIETVEQLEGFATSVNDGSQNGYAGQYIQLAADIDLDGVDWAPIGTMQDMEALSTMFMGCFDGAGHTVSNLTVSHIEPVMGGMYVAAGLFGLSGGTVCNLTVADANVSIEDGNAVGGIVGYNMHGTVYDLHVVGSSHIEGTNSVGGVIGGNAGGTIYDCSAEGVEVVLTGDNDFSEGIVQADVAECGGLIIGGSFGGTMDGCVASGTVRADGNEPVGMGGIGGCLEMMDSVTNCKAEVEIVTAGGGHAIGGLCGYSGTHSVGDIVAQTEGVVATNYPAIIKDCSLTVKMDIAGATHVGGVVGTGLYYYGEETAFSIADCSVAGTIDGAITPGAVVGRINDASDYSNVEYADLIVDGDPATEEVGQTDCLYESADQGEEEQAA